MPMYRVLGNTEDIDTISKHAREDDSLWPATVQFLEFILVGKGWGGDHLWHEDIRCKELTYSQISDITKLGMYELERGMQQLKRAGFAKRSMVYFYGHGGEVGLWDISSPLIKKVVNPVVKAKVEPVHYRTTSTDSYVGYLQSAHWQYMRAYALARAKYRCQLCNADKELHVHHRTYKDLGAEKISDLTVLCRTCHKKYHDVK